jgi:hypothetical protein
VLCKVKYEKVPIICTVVRYLFAYCWYSFIFDFPLIEYQGLFYIGFEGLFSTIIVTFFTSDLCQTFECANGKNKYSGCGNCDWPVATFRLATRSWAQILFWFFPKAGPDCAAKFEAFNNS